MNIFNQPATDMFTGRAIVYPQAVAPLQYDFLFSKKGDWFYINSSNDKQAFNAQKEQVAVQGERWAVVAPKTGEIIEQS